MTLLRSKWVLLLMLLASATSLSARPFLHSLDIRVVLSHNGDAHITETRVMDIDSEGTECYIGLGNMGGSEVRDLEVSDENGLEFTNIGSWDVDRSRDWKAGKCGIVYKHNGYELCWGLGESGSRTYTTRYVITSLVHAYPDADAIRHVFLDQDVSPKPDIARLSIEAEDSTLFSKENCGIWGFRFGGELSFEDGKIIVHNTEPFDYRGALYMMVRFDKGMFEPTIQEDDTFEHKKELAFEGSDYISEDEEWTWEDTLILLFLALSFFVVPVIGLVWYFVYVWRARKKVNKDLLWYRDIPLNGNLQQANDMLNAYKYLGTDYNNLLSACILKLINMGAISIEETLNRKGKTEQNFVIHELKNPGDQPLLLRKIHSMFKTAAGDDTILEPKELRSFMRSSKNESITDSFINTLHTKTSISNYKERLDDVRQVFGLKKFLKEFSLLDERHVNEVSLWKDYMIYATLFGIADQVIKDMKKINPEYFNMDQVAAQMANDHTLPVIYSTLHSGTSRAVANKAAREARASGHGGHSSWGGGGGGFSGGGFGGGVR
jgi:uncharacterized membrane protein YgcG